MTATIHADPPDLPYTVVTSTPTEATLCTSLTEVQAAEAYNLAHPNGHGWHWVVVKPRPCDSGEPNLRHLLVQLVRTTGGSAP